MTSRLVLESIPYIFVSAGVAAALLVLTMRSSLNTKVLSFSDAGDEVFAASAHPSSSPSTNPGPSTGIVILSFADIILTITAGCFNSGMVLQQLLLLLSTGQLLLTLFLLTLMVVSAVAAFGILEQWYNS